MKYKTIFISDVHLGSRGCQADLLFDFLKHNQADNLYLVGDILDIWALKRELYWPQSHTNVLKQILSASKNGTKIYYILGNHDKEFRRFLNLELQFGNISIHNQLPYISGEGKKYLVIHGDQFDSIIQSKTGPILTWVGNHAYSQLLRVNILINRLRKRYKLKYWSLADFMKRNTKQVLDFMNYFEDAAINYAKKSGYDGVICGHIHYYKIKEHDSLLYMNDGDWVDCCSALVETYDNKFKIIKWTGEIDDE